MSDLTQKRQAAKRVGKWAVRALTADAIGRTPIGHGNVVSSQICRASFASLRLGVRSPDGTRPSSVSILDPRPLSGALLKPASLPAAGLICLASLLVFASYGNAEAHERPNVVVVLADDLGYGDLGCYGEPEVQTPHLDQFASEGLRFTDCYAAAASCSPARTGLMTGRTPYRVGIYSAIPFLSPMHVRSSEITIATLLRDAGYTTCHVGKWHLNGWFNLPGQPQPDGHGFEHWFSTQNNALPNHQNPYNFVRNAIPLGPIEGCAGEIVVDEAIDWLRRRRDESKPFFLYVCFHEPHEPIATAERYTKLYERFSRS